MQEERHIRVSRKAMYTLIVFVFIVLLLILFLYLSRNSNFFGRGKTSSNSTQINNGSVLSPDNSYVFASPIRAKANGEQIRITVYILDDRGIGMSGKAVSIGGGNILQVNPVQPITDNQGRATFDIAGAGSPGVYIIQATVNGTTLIQKATVYFD
jgi:hypothetical protein